VKKRRGHIQEEVLYELEDLWKMADEAGRPARVMSFEEMNSMKAQGAIANGAKEIITFDGKFARTAKVKRLK
jgi:predicted nucleic-acid-binding protein